MGSVDLRILAIILTAIGWISRELWRRRQAKRQAASDAGKILSQKKALIEEMISKTEDSDSKQQFIEQLDEVNAALLGFYAKRLRHALEDAGLPPEEMLVADGRRLLQPQQATKLKEGVAEVESLPLSDSIRDLLTLASAYYHISQYQDAKKTYDRVLKLSPNNPGVLNNRGNTYYELERYDEALADYNLLVKLKPDHPTALTNRGIVYVKLERYDEALTDFNRSLELRPDGPDTLTNRGIVYVKLERYDEALTDFNRSLELRPDDPDTLTNRGVTYSKLERYEETFADHNRSLELRPDDPDTLTNRGVTYSKLERYEEAFANFNRSLEIKPDDSDTLYNLACLFSLWGRTRKALTYLEKAIRKDKKYLETAKTDKDLDNIREAPRFKKLIESD